jgi:DNA-3-methyladenine glycosylase I
MERHNRCPWPADDPLMIEYHDTEWGVPLHYDRKLFEFLVLEGMQAGLSWSTILRKRENFRKAFDDFAAERVADYGDHDIARLMADAGIIRNGMKIRAAIENARRFLAVQREFGSFDRYIWQFIDHTPIVHRFASLGNIPATTEESDLISKDLKKRGFQFVGSTIVYAHMQATGMCNDHLVSCFRHEQVRQLASSTRAKRRKA